MAPKRGYFHVLQLTLRNPKQALVNASKEGYPEIVRYLLDKGVDPSLNDYQALTGAVSQGHLEIVQMFDPPLEVFRRILHYAVWNGHLDVVRVLLDLGTPPSGVNNQPICHAIRCGHTEIAKLLLDRKGVLYHHLDLEAFETAAKRGHVEILELFLDRGLSIGKDRNHSSLLFYAVYARQIQVVKFLLDRGASIDETQYARLIDILGYTEVFQILLDRTRQ
jgi:ankyrin repeat protein